MIKNMENVTVLIGDRATLLVNEKGDELIYNKQATDAETIKKFIDLSVENAKSADKLTNPNIRFTIHLDNGFKIYTYDKTIYNYWTDNARHDGVTEVRAIGEREDHFYLVKIKMTDVKLIEKRVESIDEGKE